MLTPWLTWIWFSCGWRYWFGPRGYPLLDLPFFTSSSHVSFFLPSLSGNTCTHVLQYLPPSVWCHHCLCTTQSHPADHVPLKRPCPRSILPTVIFTKSWTSKPFACCLWSVFKGKFSPKSKVRVGIGFFSILSRNHLKGNGVMSVGETSVWSLQFPPHQVDVLEMCPCFRIRGEIKGCSHPECRGQDLSWGLSHLLLSPYLEQTTLCLFSITKRQRF